MRPAGHSGRGEPPLTPDQKHRAVEKLHKMYASRIRTTAGVDQIARAIALSLTIDTPQSNLEAIGLIRRFIRAEGGFGGMAPYREPNPFVELRQSTQMERAVARAHEYHNLGKTR